MMENDVQLLKKLLTLGETIQELRKNSSDDVSSSFQLKKDFSSKNETLNNQNDLKNVKSSPALSSEERNAKIIQNNTNKKSDTDANYESNEERVIIYNC